MWPGQQQPGGEQNPQDPSRNPYQQPGPPQHNPYQQPGYHQPNPYATPPGPTGTAQWAAPGAPAGPPVPPDGKGRRTTVIAISAAVAVVAAAVITGVVVLKDGGGKGDEPEPAAKDASPSASAPVSPSPSAAGPEDNPRAGGEVKPVIAGWKVVVNPKRHIAFDVPAEWDVAPPTAGVTIPDESDTKDGKLAEAMSGPAYFQRGQCVVKNERGYEDSYSSGITGAKGAQGAKNLQEAAENSAASWAWAMFDQKKKGKFDIGKATPFTSEHGLTGFTATTSANGVPKAHKCSTDGKAFSVAYKDTSGDFATWIFSGVKGGDGEVPDATIKKIMSTLRPLPSS